jgi:hypothetical protein
MRLRTSFFGLILLAVMSLGGLQASAQISNILDTLQKSVGPSGGTSLPDAKVADGLKEALAVGAVNAVGAVSQENGYFGNPQIKIPLPASVEKVAPVLRAVGYADQIDAFELSMNRAAERAAPVAKDMFIGAIKEMSFTDAKNILTGGDNAATLYLKEKTGPALSDAFKPIVRDTMGETGVTNAYQALETKAKAVPFGEMVSFDLDQYVTDRSLDGLFWMLGQEEANIRNNPSARVTGLLQEVFGSQ